MTADINPSSDPPIISAVVLAAGASRRMGVPKLLLQWGHQTIIEKVVQTLLDGGVIEPVIVTGRSAAEVVARISSSRVRIAINPSYETTEMLISIQIGLKILPKNAVGCLVVLGDQPQIKTSVVQSILLEFNKSAASIIIPSYQRRRGHPWLVHQKFFSEIISLPPSANLRQFLNQHSSEIVYLNIEDPAILSDLDTPQEYLRQKPLAKD
jgi:molybdenum cofactor cytidylyltransferase